MTAETAAPVPDLTHVQTWVFDLDHTLYTVPEERSLQMGERICGYVQRHLDLPREAAFALQKRYLQDYGSTLAGLVRHHSADPDDYHDAVNDIAALDLAHNAALSAGLCRLGGRRIIFTNNCGRYAADVLGEIGIADLFDAIIDAKAAGYVPKPNASAYRLLLDHGAEPGKAAMFDDHQRNLKPASDLGLTTVWCRTGPAEWTPAADEPVPGHVQYVTHDLTGFLASIRTRP